MAAALHAPVTFEEFLRVIDNKVSGKSPGITGFSINMLKSLSVVMQRKLFEVLNEMWKLRDLGVLPATWLNRWICNYIHTGGGAAGSGKEDLLEKPMSTKYNQMQVVLSTWSPPTPQ